MQAVAQFLSARDILTHSHICARLRESISFAREIAARFPGRTRGCAMPDWKFALLLEERATTGAMCFDLCTHTEKRSHRAYRTRYILLADSAKYTRDGSKVQVVLSTDDRGLILRGDVVRYSCNNFLWDGENLVYFDQKCVPYTFEVPREFPLDYFAGVIWTFSFSIQTYRAQILESLIIGKQSNRPVYRFRFIENSRVFRFRIHLGEDVEIDFRIAHAIPLSTISHIHDEWILGYFIGISHN